MAAKDLETTASSHDSEKVDGSSLPVVVDRDVRVGHGVNAPSGRYVESKKTIISLADSGNTTHDECPECGYDRAYDILCSRTGGVRMVACVACGHDIVSP